MMPEMDAVNMDDAGNLDVGFFCRIMLIFDELSLRAVCVTLLVG